VHIYHFPTHNACPDHTISINSITLCIVQSTSNESFLFRNFHISRLQSVLYLHTFSPDTIHIIPFRNHPLHRMMLYKFYSGFKKIPVSDLYCEFKDCLQYVQDFRLPLGRRWELRSYGLLRSEGREFLRDVSVEIIVPSSRANEGCNRPFKMGPITCSETSVINYH
jgi:hypothetical protein